MQKRNAQLAIEYAELEREDLKLSLKSDLSDLWQAYRNNWQVMLMERQNLVAAQENYEYANLRYMKGDLSGFEMREAQQSLLDAEERLLVSEYDTKMCEISLLQLSGKVLTYLNE
jgi:adhesin transport system outer membrane protein